MLRRNHKNLHKSQLDKHEQTGKHLFVKLLHFRMDLLSSLDRLFDFSAPLDVNLLDAAIELMYTSRNEVERKAIQDKITLFQEHPDAWIRVTSIMEGCRHVQTKFIAVHILEQTIKYRWGTLPPPQKEGIKRFAIQFLVNVSSNEAAYQANHVVVGKMNVCLVQIVKHEWPHNWPDFIPSLIESGKSNEVICENNMKIIRLISEEIFDFSAEQMTSEKIELLKGSLTQEFHQIYLLSEFVLLNATRVQLLKATLQALQRYATWIPAQYIFDTQLLELLVTKFLVAPPYQVETLRCLQEIASVQFASNYHPQIQVLYSRVLVALNTFMPVTDTTTLREVCRRRGDEAEEFVQVLTLYLTSFLNTYGAHLENVVPAEVIQGLRYIVAASHVDNEEIFNICIDFWNKWCSRLYETEFTRSGQLLGLDFSGGARVGDSRSIQTEKLAYFAPILHEARMIHILKMAKPEEVLVYTDENGDVVREHDKDVEVRARHKLMADTTVFLTHLGGEQMEKLMHEKLDFEVNQQLDKASLSKLCWAVGSISGTMSIADERKFVVAVIRELLCLCENTKGKDNKAIVASNIMYVVGQYPRFLKQHWRFLKTVVNKNFEFMHEQHPGVQDMACETFLKISKKCFLEFVKMQDKEATPFIDEILERIPEIIQDLQIHQVHLFYEACGIIIAGESDHAKRESLVDKCFDFQNRKWSHIVQQARINQASLADVNTARELARVLETNVRCASTLGPPYFSQLGRIFQESLVFFRLYSELINMHISQHGPAAKNSSAVTSYRSVKKEVLKVFTVVIEKTDDILRVKQHICGPILEPMLIDYATASHVETRDSEVLTLLATIINKLRGSCLEYVPRIFENTFANTLDMIKLNFTDYPEHRSAFYSLLAAITEHCFVTLLQLPPQAFKVVVDSVIWAFHHQERKIADIGLKMCSDLIVNVGRLPVEHQGISNAFVQAFFLQILQSVFDVLTDTLHKPGFASQCEIINLLLQHIVSGRVTVPLWDPAKENYPSNVEFISQHLLMQISTRFPHLQPPQVMQFVGGLLNFQITLEQKRVLVRNFLVEVNLQSRMCNSTSFFFEYLWLLFQLKQFKDQESNSDLFREETESQQRALAAQDTQRRQVLNMCFL